MENILLNFPKILRILSKVFPKCVAFIVFSEHLLLADNCYTWRQLFKSVLEKKILGFCKHNSKLCKIYAKALKYTREEIRFSRVFVLPSQVCSMILPGFQEHLFPSTAPYSCPGSLRNEYGNIKYRCNYLETFRNIWTVFKMSESF